MSKVFEIIPAGAVPVFGLQQKDRSREMMNMGIKRKNTWKLASKLA
jgi:hypothetical protein